MSSDGRNNDESMSSLKTSELMSMLSRGSGALAKRVSDSEDKGLAEFINAPIASILQRSKQQEDRREYKLKKELDQETQDDEQMDFDLIEEESQILQGITQVQSRLFEGIHHGGKFVNNNNLKSITKEWAEKQKRVRDNRLVIYNGLECLPDRTFEPAVSFP
jgi:SWI/SNF-related matrix-associated actin-dependent regulator of chromatin subfamily A member 5